MAFRINSPRVVHEAFDNEVVIINLESGLYYNFDQVGAVIWQTLAAGQAQARIMAEVLARYEANEGEMVAAVQAFIDELVREELIVPADSAEETDFLPPPVKEPFQKPNLRKYSDMQELLLLDPIHDVDESGWPSTKP